MRNTYIAKVLTANKLATEEVVQKYRAAVTSGKDLGMVLCEAGLLDVKTYQRVLAYVQQLEAKAQAQQNQAAAPKTVSESSASAVRSDKRFGAVPSAISKNQSGVTDNASKTFGASSRFSGTPSVSSPSSSSATFSSSSDEGLQIEGNSLYGSSASSSGVQIERVAGLESTNLTGGFQVRTTEEKFAENEEEKPLKKEMELPVRFTLNAGLGQAPAVPENLKTALSLTSVMAYARAFQVSDIYLFEGQPIVLCRFGTLARATEERIEADRVNTWLSEAVQGFADDYVPVIGANFCHTFALEGVGRARLNVTWNDVTPALSIKLIAEQSVTFENLYLPEFCADFARLDSGLVLIAGAASSGRSTTLRMFGEAVAASRWVSLQTVEKPVERLLENPNGVIVQREVGLHTSSGISGIRTAVAEGANVLLFDGITEKEEWTELLSAANSGVLVFATLSGKDIVSVIEKANALGNPSSSDSVMTSLADVLKGVVVQHLIPVVGGEGLVLATEAMKVTSTAAALLRKKGALSQIQALLPTMRGTAISLDDSLQGLLDSGYIEGVEAWKRAFDSRRFAAYRPKGN